MKLVDINFDPSKKELLEFGRTMIIGFSIFALIAYFGLAKPSIALGLFIFGCVSFGLSFLGKAALVVYVPWMGIAFVMGTIVSNLILALLFYGMITPIALCFKLMGRDPMNRSFDKKPTTYWKEAVNRDNHGVDEYEKQF